jgi:hypothetical protein
MSSDDRIEALSDRMEELARAVGKREAAHSGDLLRARQKAEELHAQVESAIRRFNQVVAESAPHMSIDLMPPRVDDKHLHSIEFDLRRGRHRAIVTIKSKGEVTLVGPFREGKNEGPCRSFLFGEEAELDGALGDFLERFIEDAATP